MTPEQWLYVSILLLVASNLATVLYAVYATRQGGEGASSRPAPADDPAADAGSGSGETVDCTECGAPNEREYRFCRRCAAELPGVWLGGSATPGLGNRSFE